MNSNSKGRIAELVAFAKFISLGYTVLQPVNKDGVYDCVIEKDGIFSTVQIKTCQRSKGVLVLKTSFVTYSALQSKAVFGRYDFSKINFVCGVDLETQKVYLVRSQECGSSALNLRIESSKNKQKKKIRFAIDYEI